MLYSTGSEAHGTNENQILSVKTMLCYSALPGYPFSQSETEHIAGGVPSFLCIKGYRFPLGQLRKHVLIHIYKENSSDE